MYHKIHFSETGKLLQLQVWLVQNSICSVLWSYAIISALGILNDFLLQIFLLYDVFITRNPMVNQSASVLNSVDHKEL